MRNLRRAAAWVLLSLTLGAPWAFASEAPPKAALQASQAAGPSLLETLQSFLGWIWTAQPFSTASAASHAVCTAGEAGCGIDPLGGQQTLTVDAGCGLDPLGHCVTGH